MSAKNCLGRKARDKGHKREPVPPDKITGNSGASEKEGMDLHSLFNCYITIIKAIFRATLIVLTLVSSVYGNESFSHRVPPLCVSARLP